MNSNKLTMTVRKKHHGKTGLPLVPKKQKRRDRTVNPVGSAVQQPKANPRSPLSRSPAVGHFTAKSEVQITKKQSVYTFS